MMNMTELFTIALPVYKRTDYIRSALDSCVKQTVPCRILLIDNNSPHNEFKEIIDSYNNPLIKYVKTDETVPQDENFNNCFRYAETPWVTILHDDDMLHCQFVELVQHVFTKYPKQTGGIVVQSHVGEKEWDGIYDKYDSFTKDIKIVREPYFYFYQLTPFPGVVVKKDTALEIGGFKSELHPIADYDFWFRYCKAETMLMVNQEFTYYRISPTQSTNHLIDAMINNIYEYRLNEIMNSKYNNVLAKLGLEYRRLVNIRFFKDTYPNIVIEKINNKENLDRAEKRLKNRLVSAVVRRYIDFISYGKL